VSVEANQALVRSLPPRLRTRLSTKLGRCVRTSMLGTLVGWTGVALVTTVWSNPILLIAPFGKD
jgi:cell wall assembly regulator SMI1